MLLSRPSAKFLPLIALIIFLILVLDILWISHKEYLFERQLDSLYITPSEFTAAGHNYTEKLFEAGRESFTYDFPPPKQDSNDTIPPLIHYIWYDNLYPPHQRRSIPSNAPDLCIKYNPAFTIKIWNEDEVKELLNKKYSWFLPTYDAYAEGVQRVDAAKYFILLEYGGVYADHDISCRKGLYPLLDFAAWFPRASPLGINNDLMATRPGHPLMWKMVTSLKRRDRNLLFPWLTIFWSTGPRFATDMLHEYLDERSEQARNRDSTADIGSRGENGTRIINPSSVSILPSSMYSESLQFFGHRQGGTWYGWDVAIIIWIGAHWCFMIFIVMFTILSAILLASKQSRARVLRVLTSLRRRQATTAKRKQDDDGEAGTRLLDVM
jgi:mannosyltransferase OCH1-like enzyme